MNELAKNVQDYKSSKATTNNEKDIRFQREVRACLNEQLVYVNEL
jgi:hypothetical protein